jgi:hypothetical protein
MMVLEGLLTVDQAALVIRVQAAQDTAALVAQPMMAQADLLTVDQAVQLMTVLAALHTRDLGGNVMPVLAVHAIPALGVPVNIARLSADSLNTCLQPRLTSV